MGGSLSSKAYRAVGAHSVPVGGFAAYGLYPRLIKT